MIEEKSAIGDTSTRPMAADWVHNIRILCVNYKHKYIVEKYFYLLSGVSRRHTFDRSIALCATMTHLHRWFRERIAPRCALHNFPNWTVDSHAHVHTHTDKKRRLSPWDINNRLQIIIHITRASSLMHDMSIFHGCKTPIFPPGARPPETFRTIQHNARHFTVMCNNI